MKTKQTLIQLEGVNFAYPGGDPVLRGLDFHLQKGDRIGLVAPNGSGKTTLFHLIMGLVKPSSGTIELFGQEVSQEKEFCRVRTRIGLLFQDADDQLFSPTVLEDVAFGPLNLGKSETDAVALARQTLFYLGLEGFERRLTYTLSGGEKRLVALATILALEPEILLLDEPTSGLDKKTKTRLRRILAEIDLSYVLISHEYDFLVQTSEHIYTLENGCISMDDELYMHSHQHAHPTGKLPHNHSS